MKTASILASMAFGLNLAQSLLAAAEPPSGATAPRLLAAAEFFEVRVRPVLVERCLSCHGPEHHRGGLRLDSREAVLAGGRSGAVVVLGDPDMSRLIQAVRHEGRLKMPPGGKLPSEAVTALSEWVKMGAPWSASAVTVAGAQETWKKHWAFQPIQKPALPAVSTGGWGTSPIDAFIFARFHEKGLQPSSRADRRTLIRRATFDLIGLPPTAEEIAAFEADASPEAFARVVDRLLASPRYGERWGRYWLDVARYADTRGYVFQEERKFPWSYTYRDYVIQAFNRDLPYDRFVEEQLAADQLTPGPDKHALAAVGFLTVGSHFMNNPHDIIDDRIDVVCRGMLGLTVTCARCHDHKFDPIPTQDYYSLYGVFASSSTPEILPVISAPEKNAAYAAYDKELHRLQENLSKYLKAKHAELMVAVQTRIADYLLAARAAQQHPGTERFMFVSAPGDLNPVMLQRWRHFLEGQRPGFDPVFTPWHAFAALPAKDFAAQAPSLAARYAANADPQARLNPLVAQAFAGKAPANLQEVAQRYGRLFAEADKGQKPASLPGDAADRKKIYQALHAPGAPLDVPASAIEHYLVDRASRDQLTHLRRDIDHFSATAPGSPPRAMVLVDAPEPYNPHVFVRGNPHNQGAAVPRQFLQFLSGPHRQPFQHGSGRLELAQSIVQKSNPLTARVMVNRIWLHHFGAGLVRTPSDFGLRSEPPTHPQLLDYLASQFMEEGWSIKKMHRMIMLSSVYQQASDDRPDAHQADPENRLLWRMNRQRLDFEALRDSLLATGAGLDLSMGGRPVSLTDQPFSTRRSVYGFIDRQNLPALFRTFDFPAPDATSPQRYQTTVPLQALFMLNSPFVIEQARRVVNVAEVASQAEPQARIRALYRLIYGRAPAPEEVALGQHYLQNQGQEKAQPAPGAVALTAWERYGQVLLLANEFVFVD